ncbi:hypothetical protein E2562_033341 [Oryza meyeriana var. granulata]|uniref:Uncharacterized protein n=1 Tax=Oryza meyeriana var. granulata TaxID=110450 RepID=A0A6G1E600_9ORYZ|nr:hypothetical protein E2562_033341 [Oryza meyeriana var. granulata]
MSISPSISFHHQSATASAPKLPLPSTLTYPMVAAYCTTVSLQLGTGADELEMRACELHRGLGGAAVAISKQRSTTRCTC